MQAFLDRLYREQFGKMVSGLMHYFGIKQIAIAEDIVQDSFMSAMQNWSVHGLPDKPVNWLFKVCRNKALNHLKKAGALPNVLSAHSEDGDDIDLAGTIFLENEIADHQLRLLFACCHPSLSPRSQLILILRYLCSLKVQEIARALIMSEEAVIKTITRSKHKIESEGNLEVPFIDVAGSRMNVVHIALYLLFNEGYAPSEGDDIIRKDLCLEAMRLTRAIIDLPFQQNADTYALMALMCFHSARFDSRLGVNGGLIELEFQDREKWDRDLIALGNHYLKQCSDQDKSSRFVIEAAILWVHVNALKFEYTDWRLILHLYERLSEVSSSPFIDLNRAVALFYAENDQASLNFLKGSKHLFWLNNYALYHAFLGKVYSSVNDNGAARRFYKKALSLTKLRAEKNFLRKKIESLQDD